jgi:hypothetical protein
LRSRKAAERLGFTLESIFRQATIQKCRNRDTAWYSILALNGPPSRLRLKPGSIPANLTPKAVSFNPSAPFAPGRTPNRCAKKPTRLAAIVGFHSRQAGLI